MLREKLVGKKTDEEVTKVPVKWWEHWNWTCK
jgi:hypothetical protein